MKSSSITACRAPPEFVSEPGLADLYRYCHRGRIGTVNGKGSPVPQGEVGACIFRAKSDVPIFKYHSTLRYFQIQKSKEGYRILVTADEAMSGYRDECYSVQEMMRIMASKIHSTADLLSDEEIQHFLREILTTQRIYVLGAGRSGLVAKAFAMRLMHLGLHSYVVGETITPSMKAGDVLVAFSGSGETNTVAELAETSKKIGGRLCLVTAKKNSRIGRIADCVVVIESHRDEVKDESAEFEIRQMTGEHKSFAPLGTLFETAAMVFADAIVSALMEITHCDIEDLRDRHANIE